MSAPEIATITLSPQKANLETTFPATIQGKTDIAIRPQVTGFITKVHVDEGQHVRKGQALFTSERRRCRHHPQPRRLSGKSLVGHAPHHCQRQF